MLTQPPAVGSASAGFSTLQDRLANPTDELVSPFVDLLTRLEELPLLFEMVTANEQSKPFVSQCLKIASEGPDVAKLWPPETVVERWSLMEEVFEPDELDQVIKRLSSETELHAYIEGRDFDPEIAGLYASAVRVGSGDVKKFGGWCVDALRAVDSPSWLKQMREEGPLMGLLFALLDAGVDVQLDIAYQDALVDHGEALLDGSQTAFLNNADEAGLRWLVGLVRDNLDTVNDVFSGKPGFQDFRQRLRKRISESDDEGPDEKVKQLAEIARLLKIPSTRTKSS